MTHKEVSVQTEFGTLVAQVGLDTDFPEILVYLRKNSGPELMLAAITDNSILAHEGYEDNAELRIAVYSDTKSEDYSVGFVLKHSDIESDDAAWQ